jgi:hypothetical protein
MLHLAFGGLLTLGVVSATAGNFLLTNEGEARAAIILESGSPSALHSAAELLAEYVEKSSGATMPVRDTDDGDLMPVRICVAPDDFADKNEEIYRINVNVKGVEIRAATPRAAYYAVVELLEHELGVRWWNFAGEELVPWNPTISIKAGERSARPAVAVRDLMMPGRALNFHYPMEPSDAAKFWARWRLNGSIGTLHLKDMSLHPYGGPRHPLRTHCAHTLGYQFLKPNVWLEEQPEIFALIDGKRSKDGYSFANPAFRTTLLAELREAMKTNGDGVYVVSPPDNWAFCQSAEERAFEQKHAARVASYLDAMNEISGKLETEHPGAQLEMLAYTAYEDPPVGLKLSTRVALRFCPITRYHWDPFDAPINQPWLEKLRKWRSVAAHVEIWEYPGHYGSPEKDKQGKSTVFRGYDRFFPQPNIFNHGRDFTAYVQAGASGIFSETDAGMAELYCEAEPRYWLIARMLWQPKEDSKKLLREFCEGFYGPAGNAAMEYFELINTAYRADSTRIAAHLGDMARQSFFTEKFCLRAHEIFDSGATGLQEPVLMERWDRLRLSLDLATLFYWNSFEAQGSVMPFSRGNVEDRLRRTRLLTIARYFPTYPAGDESRRVDDLLQAARETPTAW